MVPWRGLHFSIFFLMEKRALPYRLKTPTAFFLNIEKLLHTKHSPDHSQCNRRHQSPTQGNKNDSDPHSFVYLLKPVFWGAFPTLLCYAGTFFC